MFPGILLVLPVQWILLITNVFNAVYLSGAYPQTWSKVTLIKFIKNGDTAHVANC